MIHSVAARIANSTNKRRLRRAVVVACVLLAAVLSATGNSAAGERLRLLHFGGISQAASVPVLATAIRQAREEAEGTVLVTNGGDMLAPSLLSSLDKGRHMVELMNAIGVDMAAPGNHEFDFGEAVLEERIGESEFLWLSSNLSPSLSGTTGHEIISVGPYSVGVMGLTTAQTKTISLPDAGTAIRDPEAVAESMARRLRASDADLVVAIAHVDQGVALALLEHVDVVLGGQDIWLEARLDHRGLFAQTDPQGRHLAVIDLDLDTVEGEFVWTPSLQFVSTSGLSPDPALQEVSMAVEAMVTEALDETVGVAKAAFDTRRPGLTQAENAFGNLVVDAIRNRAGTDVAMINSGAIRGERVYRKGEAITRRDLRMELPYPSMIPVLEVTGATMLEALENGVAQYDDAKGRFPQISGLAFEFDPAAPVGSRVRAVTVAGAPLDTGRTYSLATNEFLAGGGDGYTMLGSASMVAEIPASVLEAVTAWVAAKGGFDGGATGRIRVLP